MSITDPCLLVSLVKGHGLSDFPGAWVLTLTEREGRTEGFAQKWLSYRSRGTTFRPGTMGYVRRGESAFVKRVV